VSLVQKATAINQRMLKLLEYYSGDDPADGVEIISILGVGQAVYSHARAVAQGESNDRAVRLYDCREDL
jgi:hypothetical protein